MTDSTVFEGYSPLSGLGTARYLIQVQPVFCELSLICISASVSSTAFTSGGSRDLVRNTGLRHDGAITIFVNASNRIQEEAMLSFILIWVVIVVLVGFSQNISKKIDQKVIEPIERIGSKI